MPLEREGRPTLAGNRPYKLDADQSSSSLLQSIDALDDIARHVGGTFVVVVEVTGDKYRRRCFLTVKAAQNAAQRATDRGETATVYLAQMKPLWKVRGGEVA